MNCWSPLRMAFVSDTLGWLKIYDGLALTNPAARGRYEVRATMEVAGALPSEIDHDTREAK